MAVKLEREIVKYATSQNIGGPVFLGDFISCNFSCLHVPVANSLPVMDVAVGE